MDRLMGDLLCDPVELDGSEKHERVVMKKVSQKEHIMNVWLVLVLRMVFSGFHLSANLSPLLFYPPTTKYLIVTYFVA